MKKILIVFSLTLLAISCDDILDISAHPINLGD